MALTTSTARPDLDHAPTIGVIGGSGFYTFLSNATEVTISTPFGPPSDPLTVGEVAGRTVAFIPRHGRDHRLPPHRVNYRANLWALRSLGVRQVLGPCAVGSLVPQQGPGTLVVPDQVVDRTWGRDHTVFDDVTGPVLHVSLADPYCPRGRRHVLDTATSTGTFPQVVDGGTMVVINGPRFSTRAESRWHRDAGWSVVGMTGLPEAALARELALCYTSIALVTDLDAGVQSGEGVTHEEVMRVFAGSVEHLKSVLVATIAALPEDDDCSCQHVLDGLALPFDLP